jgi:hypothetical protein
MKNRIPQGPFENPHVEDGIYAAEIDHLVEGSYGDQQTYLRIVVRLSEHDLYFVTNLYFPKNRSVRSEQRLWHFCQIVGLDKQDVATQPELFVGRLLRLQIARRHSLKLNYGRPYSDVELFLPAEGLEPEISTAENVAHSTDF